VGRSATEEIATVTAIEDLKRAICALFEVHADEDGVQRVVTPLEYPGSGDQVIVRVRPFGRAWRIDENGEAALYASLAGGDLDAEVVGRWAEDLLPPIGFGEDEMISAMVTEPRLVTASIFRVASAAQQLFALATARADRQHSDLKDRVADIVRSLAVELKVKLESDVQLPIAGGLQADHVLALEKPLIVVVATTAARLLEAEIIHMQYRADRRAGTVLAVAESQASVGKKQFERAGYYTGKTVVFDEDAFPDLIEQFAGR
jgi:hypothetical protein